MNALGEINTTSIITAATVPRTDISCLETFQSVTGVAYLIAAGQLIADINIT